MKAILLIIFILIWIRMLTAPPGVNIPVLLQRAPLNNNEAIWQAICDIESHQNILAYCIDVNGKPSVGIGQIQYSRVREFNQQTGKNYTHNDMFDPVKAREVFDHYAAKSNNEEHIIRCWNGGEPNGIKKKSTIKYWNKVKSRL